MRRFEPRVFRKKRGGDGDFPGPKGLAGQRDPPKHVAFGYGTPAMKRRENQLRLRRFRVDELQRRMGTLEGIEADLVRKLADLEDTVARERQRANETDLGLLAFPSFLKAMDSRRENLKATLKEFERERSQTKAEFVVACQELKSVELTAEQEARRAAEAPLDKSRMRLGEIALARQLRKQALRQI